jgi:signal transduction histidine kinase
VSRRILTAIVVVTALGIAGFGVPLAVAVQRLYRNEALVRLGREAARAGAQVPSSFRTSGDPVELPAPDKGTQLGLYAPDGRRLLGVGPDRGGDAVARAATGQLTESTHGALVVASPLTGDEQVFAIVRAELPASAVAHRVHRAWLLMSALGMMVIVAAAFVGRALSRRIARPVGDLASTTARLGGGDFSARATRSGIAELDIAAENLDVTAQRLGQLVDRERAFSADVSHQLRTPVTGLRLHLETALANPTVDSDAAMTVALSEVDRLEHTIDDLLALARDVDADPGSLDLADVVEDVERAWHGRLAAIGRPLRVDLDHGASTPHASPGAVRQILEVLVSNAEVHGRGTVRVSTRPVTGGVAIDVDDEGPGVTGDTRAIFERRADGEAGHGIGLALARSLAEAEGARLLLVESGPSPTFRLVLRTGESPE